jgi:hypothetical protein
VDARNMMASSCAAGVVCGTSGVLSHSAPPWSVRARARTRSMDRFGPARRACARARARVRAGPRSCTRTRS